MSKTRRSASKKPKEYESSELEDEPEPYESSGDEWKDEEKNNPKQTRRSQRSAKRPRMDESDEEDDNDEDEKDEDESDEDSEDEKAKPKSKGSSKNGTGKKRGKPPTKTNGKSGSKKKGSSDDEEDKNDGEEKDDDDDEDFDDEENENDEDDEDFDDDFDDEDYGAIRDEPLEPGQTRVVEANDFTSGSFVISKQDASKFKKDSPPSVWRVDGKALLQKYEPENGENKHLSTSIYTGWSTDEKDLYTPITVTIVEQSNNKLKIVVDWVKFQESKKGTSK